MSELLELRDVSVHYGQSQALWDISFSVSEGSIVALLGPNGAGKTTLLNAIAGLLPVTKGEIMFEGKSVGNLPANQRVNTGLSLVPEGRRLFAFSTVRVNLEMGAYTRRARQEKEQTIRQIFSLFPVLKERVKQMAGTLSGGEQQMLAIARALMSKPKVLMMDEPSIGLAPAITIKLFEKIRQINNEGTTILLVEQNVRDSLKLAGEAFVMETGRIAMHGTGGELLGNKYVKSAYLGL